LEPYRLCQQADGARLVRVNVEIARQHDHVVGRVAGGNVRTKPDDVLPNLSGMDALNLRRRGGQNVHLVVSCVWRARAATAGTAYVLPCRRTCGWRKSRSTLACPAYCRPHRCGHVFGPATWAGRNAHSRLSTSDRPYASARARERTRMRRFLSEKDGSCVRLLTVHPIRV